MNEKTREQITSAMAGALAVEVTSQSPISDMKRGITTLASEVTKLCNALLDDAESGEVYHFGDIFQAADGAGPLYVLATSGEHVHAAMLELPGGGWKPACGYSREPYQTEFTPGNIRNYFGSNERCRRVFTAAEFDAMLFKAAGEVGDAD